MQIRVLGHVVLKVRSLERSVAFKVGDSLDELSECKAYLEQHGVTILGSSDHSVS